MGLRNDEGDAMSRGAMSSYGKPVLAHAATACLTLIVVIALFGDRLGPPAAARSNFRPRRTAPLFPSQSRRPTHASCARHRQCGAPCPRRRAQGPRSRRAEQRPRLRRVRTRASSTSRPRPRCSASSATRPPPAPARASSSTSRGIS